jgi:hypothetical protein
VAISIGMKEERKRTKKMRKNPEYRANPDHPDIPVTTVETIINNFKFYF